jgi:AAA domain
VNDSPPAGLQPIELATQYRIHPSICAFPNRNFYEDQQRNTHCVLHRHIDEQFETWARKYHNCRQGDRSVFISAAGSEVLQELKGTSKFNLADADIICDVVQSIASDGGIDPKAIMLTCYYKAQVRLISAALRKIGNSSVRVTTVEKNQLGVIYGLQYKPATEPSLYCLLLLPLPLPLRSGDLC